MNGPSHYRLGEAYLTQASRTLLKIKETGERDDPIPADLERIMQNSLRFAEVHFLAAQVAATISGPGVGAANRAEWSDALKGGS